jgi:hypothetical protein
LALYKGLKMSSAKERSDISLTRTQKANRLFEIRILQSQSTLNRRIPEKA